MLAVAIETTATEDRADGAFQSCFERHSWQVAEAHIPIDAGIPPSDFWTLYGTLWRLEGLDCI